MTDFAADRADWDKGFADASEGRPMSLMGMGSDAHRRGYVAGFSTKCCAECERGPLPQFYLH